MKREVDRETPVMDRVPRISLCILCLLLLLAGTRPQVAQAHGGGAPQLTNVEAGPYRVSAWTQPDPLRAGEVHLSVAVSGSEDEAPVLDATVGVRVEPLDQAGDVITTFATHEAAANKLLYEADLELPAEGYWRVILSVEGPAGSGSASFETRVFPPRTVPWTLLGGLGLVLLAAIWMVQMFRNGSHAGSGRSPGRTGR